MRGWTLQELLAPTSVESFLWRTSEFEDKNSIVYEIQDITGIPIEALQGTPLQQLSTKERMTWAENAKQSARKLQHIDC
jgi:hypothetical protein